MKICDAKDLKTRRERCERCKDVKMREMRRCEDVKMQRFRYVRDGMGKMSWERSMDRKGGEGAEVRWRR
jgi:hypothetical protein